MKLVITVVGKDRVGIIAAVTKILAENEVNILSINQNILNGFFNMILFAESDEKIIRAEIFKMISDLSMDLNHNENYLAGIFEALKNKADITTLMRGLLDN